jgi:hypothetical protein
MNRTTCAPVVTLLLLTVGLVPTVNASEIPAFARKYRVSCSLCHNPAPTLSEFGETFAGNGFRFAPQEEPRDTIGTGDELLQLMRDVPLAFRLDAYVQAYTGGDFATDLQTPYNLKILSGGTISKKLSYYLYFFLYERGEIGGIEDAFVQLNDLNGAPVDLVVGQFQVSDPMFKRELRLEFQDYAVYRARVGLQPADLTYDRGLMVVADAAGFTITGEVVNGNGRGEAEPNRRLDNDVFKSLFGHVTHDLAEHLRVGAMGYWGKQEGAADTGDPEVTNRVWMIGVDATIAAGSVELNGQYIHREDNAPTFDAFEETANTDGGFVELILRPPQSRWYLLGLYNLVHNDRNLLNARLGGPSNIERYEALTAGVGYLARRNFRLLGEVTWDMEQDRTRWTLGLVTAF